MILLFDAIQTEQFTTKWWSYYLTLSKQSNAPVTDDLTIQRSAIWVIQIGFQ
jgi:hypothetical protein